MAIITTTFQRAMSELETFREDTIDDIKTSFNAWVATKAADTTKTYTVRCVMAGWDGEKYFAVGEATYPEINSDPTQQVPELP